MKKKDTTALVFDWIVIAGLWGIIGIVTNMVITNHQIIQAAGGY